MEEDDEFGDLYTDVLNAFPSSSSATASRLIDHNIQSNDVDVDVGVDVDASDSQLNKNKTQKEEEEGEEEENKEESSTIQETRVLQEELDKVGDDLNVKDLGSEPIIPGLTLHIQKQKQEEQEQEDDWGSDSDSEDDLQIVLNDNHHGPLAMGGMNIDDDDDDDDDEDGDPLIIVADDEAAAQAQAQAQAQAHQLQPAEDQDWGEDATQASNNDAKDLTDTTKPNASLPLPPKIGGYNNYAYHPFHSQFKYIRPGAAPLPGVPSTGLGGTPGQVRSPVTMGAVAGRGRGDWRPPSMKAPMMQKGFHSGFWGSNGLGRGLEFTLPSHKTIFDVNIDSFEEKPWRYPGVDVSDFFNFGLNEDSWVEYCKQLEQLRLESTMQSKIRVYESGRAEQEYDRDLPPELAAAAGIHDSLAENADPAKVDSGLGDVARGSTRVRPPLPIGRAIQVETGSGERLPSVDTRPPRLRDSDAVIEIVLEGSMDDESSSKDAPEHPNNDSGREDEKVDVDSPQDGDESYDRYSQGCDGRKEDVTGKMSPVINFQSDKQEEEREISSQRTSSDCQLSPTKKVASSNEDRWTKAKTLERSPHISSVESALDRRSLDYQQEDSIGSVAHNRSPVLSSPNPMEGAQDPSLERHTASENDISAEKNPENVKEDISVVVSSNTSKDKNRVHSTKHQKLSSHVEPPATKDDDDGVDFKVSRNSDNSKATGSSRHQQKWHDGADEEEVQNGRSTYLGDLKRHRGDGGHDFRRKDRDRRTEVERTYMLKKGKEENHRNRDLYGASHVQQKSEGIDQRKERDYSEVSWSRRDDDAHDWRVRVEETRKQDLADGTVPKHRGKVREIERSDKDEYLHSRKLLDNGSWRGYHDKDVGLRYREIDDSLKSRHGVLDDHHGKRRKDEHARRDRAEKQGLLLYHTESSSTRRKRERDDISNQRKRDDPQRAGDNMEHHHHSVRLNDEVWVQRERAVQQRERDEWYRPKLSYEENLSRREREDGGTPIRGSRNVKEKMWVGHTCGKEEYKDHDKDSGKYGEQVNRRDRVEDETSLQHRGSDDGYKHGSHISNEVKRSRKERFSARNDRPDHAPDNQRVHEKRHKDYVRKARESEGTSGPSGRHQGQKGLANEMAVMKGINEHAEAEQESLVRHLTGESRDDISSDDDQQGSKRGRSKLERWTSHKERDYAINSKLSSSSKVKDISKDITAGSQSSYGAQAESTKKVEDMDKSRWLPGAKDEGSEEKDADAKPIVDGHLDTVAKLKRRSERFKLPLTSEKDNTAIKKVESEVLPPSQSEIPVNSEVKQERPARKRRWISN